MCLFQKTHSKIGPSDVGVQNGLIPRSIRGFKGKT